MIASQPLPDVDTPKLISLLRHYGYGTKDISNSTDISINAINNYCRKTTATHPPYENMRRIWNLAVKIGCSETDMKWCLKDE